MQCPSCQRDVSPSGSLDVDGRQWTVYQCDHCTRLWEFDGETFPTALTFAADADGNCFDPDTLEPLRIAPSSPN